MQTISELIDGLGGVGEVAKLVGVSTEAVYNAIRRKHLPYRWRLPLADEAKRRKLSVVPALFDHKRAS